jgi:hypothetical protein
MPAPGTPAPDFARLTDFAGVKALGTVLAERPANPAPRPGIGCNIKWNPGNAPDYSSR